MALFNTLAVLIAGVAASSIHNIPRIAEARMPMVIMSGSTVASGGGSPISEVTLNESTPNAWDALTGDSGESLADDTVYAAAEKADISSATYQWYIGRLDVIGAGANQIDAGTTAAQINDATLTLTLYGSRDGEAGDVLQVCAINESFAWKDSAGDPIVDDGPADDGVSYNQRNDGSTEKQSIPASTSWTAGDIEDELSDCNTITFGDAGWTTAAVVIDVTDIVKYWVNNPSGEFGFTVQLSTMGGEAFEFYHFDGTTPPSILVNDGL
jgi:hypothetical protein